MTPSRKLRHTAEALMTVLTNAGGGGEGGAKRTFFMYNHVFKGLVRFCKVLYFFCNFWG